MRPRINKFGKITFNELQTYLNEHNVFGFTVKRNISTLTYTFLMMFRDNGNGTVDASKVMIEMFEEDPKELYIEVSNNSKLVICAYTNKGKNFNNIDELKQYIYGK